MWNSRCSPCPHRAGRAAHCMWSAFGFQGQVQSPICPCEIAGKPPQGQLHSCGIFIKDPQNPSQSLGPPLQEGDLVVFTVHRHVYTFLNLKTQPFQHTVSTIRQPFQHTVSTIRQPLQYTVLLGLHHRTPHKSPHIRICVTWMGPLPAQAPFQIVTLPK